MAKISQKVSTLDKLARFDKSFCFLYNIGTFLSGVLPVLNLSEPENLGCHTQKMPEFTGFSG
jgi:hypothetical protein